MQSQKISRRKALAGAGAAVAGGIAAASPALAHAGDIELQRLWAEWLVQLTAWSRANRVNDETLHQAISAGKAAGEYGAEAYLDVRRAEEQRLGVPALEAAEQVELDKMYALEAKIVDTPANGPFGFGVKLALGKHYGVKDADDCAHAPVMSAYRDMTRLTGVDPAEQAKVADRLEGHLT